MFLIFFIKSSNIICKAGNQIFNIKENLLFENDFQFNWTPKHLSHKKPHKNKSLCTFPWWSGPLLIFIYSICHKHLHWSTDSFGVYMVSCSFSSVKFQDTLALREIKYHNLSSKYLKKVVDGDSVGRKVLL